MPVSTATEAEAQWYVITNFETEDLATGSSLINKLNSILTTYQGPCARLRAMLLTHNVQVTGRQRMKWYILILLAVAGKAAREVAKSD